MTKTEKINKEKTKIIEFEVPSGMKITMDLSKATTRVLMRARTFAEGGYESVPYMISQICLFDGEKLTADEIMDTIDLFDYTAIEEMWGAQKKPVTSASQTPTT